MKAHNKRIRMSKYIKPGALVKDMATMGENLVFCDENARTADVLSIMLNKGIRRVPVSAGSTGNFSGIISTTDMLDFLGAGERHSTFLKKKVGLDVKAGAIMHSDVRTVDRNQDVSTAIAIMLNNNVGGLPVTDKGKLVGMISESDIVRRIKGRVGFRVEEIMRRKPFFVKERYPVIDVARIIVHGPYRRLPVVKEGILVGIVTPSDILKYLNKRKGLRELAKDKSPIMRAMNPNTVYTKPKSRVHEAIETMIKRHIGGLPVVECDEMDIVGILTENDIIKLLA